MSGERLIFVYNADGGLLNALKDAWHKAVSPDTYQCSLCAVTYGAVSMRPKWKAYLRTLPFPAVFMHRDEWREAFPQSTEDLPAVFLQGGDELPRLLVPAAKVNGVETLDDMTALIDDSIAAQDGQAV
jgi:hypothetical protein